MGAVTTSSSSITLGFVRATYAASEQLALSGFLVNGWNNTFETNSDKTFIGQAILTPNDQLTWVGNFIVGNEGDFDADGEEDLLWLFDTTASFVVSDQLSIMGNFDYGQASDLVATDEALDHRHVDPAGNLVLASADLTDVFGCEVEKDGQLDPPLVEKLRPVDQNQRAAPAACDQLRTDHGLARTRWCDEDADVVGEQGARGLLLHLGELAMKLNFDRVPVDAPVVDLQ